jgi:hypothetical protein
MMRRMDAEEEDDKDVVEEVRETNLTTAESIKDTDDNTTVVDN